MRGSISSASRRKKLPLKLRRRPQRKQRPLDRLPPRPRRSRLDRLPHRCAEHPQLQLLQRGRRCHQLPLLRRRYPCVRPAHRRLLPRQRHIRLPRDPERLLWRQGLRGRRRLRRFALPRPVPQARQPRERRDPQALLRRARGSLCARANPSGRVGQALPKACGPLRRPARLGPRAHCVPAHPHRDSRSGPAEDVPELSLLAARDPVPREGFPRQNPANHCMRASLPRRAAGR